MAEQEESLGVTGPGGVGLTFKGSQMFPVIMLILLASVVTYGLFVHDNKADARALETVAALKSVNEAVSKAEGTQRAMIYVLSLSSEERQKLNLTKPRELSEMQR